MKFRSQKKLASRMFGVGVKRIWFDPLRLDEVQQAITREDVGQLIKDRAIRLKSTKPRAKNLPRKKRNEGRRKIRVANRKKGYINRIRKMRGHLSQLYDKGEISREKRDKVRGLAKAGQFRNLRHLKESLKGIGAKE